MILKLMDNLALNASSQKLVLGFTANPRTDATAISNKPLFCSFKIPKRSAAIYQSKPSISTPRAICKSDVAKDCFAKILSSSGQHSSSQVGSIMFWVGVGVALSLVFSSAASYLKKYAMTMIGKMCTQTNQSATAAISPCGSSATSPVSVDVPPTKTKPTESKDDDESTKEPTKSGAKHNGVTVELLEKVMDDPTVLKMVYPYVPEELRNPTSLKRMLQDPQHRQRLQDMLNDMGESPEWRNRMMDWFKDIDLNSPEFKEQFDQIGLAPEEAVSKIMANPEVAMAFQNPRVQAAIMECSQNPMSIIKYQNDKGVIDVFNKISELFPEVTGAP